MKIKQSNLFVSFILLFVAVIWGGGFVSQKVGAAYLGSSSFNSLRFGLAALALTVLTGRITRIKQIANLTLQTPVFSLCLFLGAQLQQKGLALTTAGKGAFITGLYIVIIPLFHAIIFKERPSKYHWLGALIASLGLAGVSGVTFATVLQGSATGDLLILTAAIIFAAHFVLVERKGSYWDSIDLSISQCIGCATLSLISAIFFESYSLQSIMHATPSILYQSLISVSLGYTLQIWAQRKIPAGQASLILSLESVFGAIAGSYLLGETFDNYQIICAIIMSLGVGIAQLPMFLKKVEATI